MTDTVLTNLQNIMRETFDDDALVVEASTTAADVADWDSMNHVRLIVAIEEDIGVTLPMERVSDLQNVGELVALIEDLSK